LALVFEAAANCCAGFRHYAVELADLYGLVVAEAQLARVAVVGGAVALPLTQPGYAGIDYHEDQ